MPGDRLINGIQSYSDLARVISAIAIDGINQYVNVFNAASRNCIVLAGMTTEGDFLSSLIQKDLSDAFYRRDPASLAAVSDTDYEEDEHLSVKISGGFGPIKVPSALLMFVQNGGGMPGPAEASAMNWVGQQLQQVIIKDQLNTGIGGCAAALASIPAVTLDASLGGKTIDQLLVNDALALFGDMSPKIVGVVMNGAAAHQLLGDAIANSNALDTVGGVTINTGVVPLQGRALITTDAPALSYNDGVTDVYQMLLLVEGGIVLNQANEESMIENVMGVQNLAKRFQSNYDYRFGLKGIGWDGSITSPTDAELFTGANYDQKVGSVKHIAGTTLITPQVAT